MARTQSYIAIFAQNIQNFVLENNKRQLLGPEDGGVAAKSSWWIVISCF